MDRSSRACAHNKRWSTAKATWYLFATAANTFPLSRHTNRNNHSAAIQRQPEELGEFFQLFWRPLRVFQPSHFIFGMRWAKDNMGAENRRRGGQQGREKNKERENNRWGWNEKNTCSTLPVSEDSELLALRPRKEAPSLKYNYSSLYVTNWQAKLEECWVKAAISLCAISL